MYVGRQLKLRSRERIMLNYLEFDSIDSTDPIDRNIGTSLRKRNHIDGESLVVEFSKTSTRNRNYAYV